MKSKVKKKTKSPKQDQKLSKEVLSEIKHLEVLLKFSLESTDSKWENLRTLFQNQVSKIETQINKLKQSQ